MLGASPKPNPAASKALPDLATTLQIGAPYTGDVVKISTVLRSGIDPVLYRW